LCGQSNVRFGRYKERRNSEKSKKIYFIIKIIEKLYK
jgi:hypothetical protein